VGGWMINCTAKVDASHQSAGFYQFIQASQDYTKYINCQIDISNCVSPTYFRNPNLDPSTTAFGLTLTNSIVSLQSNGQTGLNAVNDAQHLIHNAYYLPQISANPSLEFTGDVGGVTLPYRFASGRVPSLASPLYDGGVADGLEYDQRRQPRGSRRTIGPLAGAALPMPSDVSIRWGVESKSLGTNSVVPSNMTDRIVLSFATDVDVQPASLRLFSDTAAIPIGDLTYDPVAHTASWLLTAPLPIGRYSLELDTQPIKSFRILPGDINGDGTVSASDFILFRQVFGSNSSLGDFNGDGSTDSNDFLLFRQVFGSSI